MTHYFINTLWAAIVHGEAPQPRCFIQKRLLLIVQIMHVRCPLNQINCKLCYNKPMNSFFMLENLISIVHYLSFEYKFKAMMFEAVIYCICTWLQGPIYRSNGLIEFQISLSEQVFGYSLYTHVDQKWKTLGWRFGKVVKLIWYVNISLLFKMVFLFCYGAKCTIIISLRCRSSYIPADYTRCTSSTKDLRVTSSTTRGVQDPRRERSRAP